MDRARSAWGWLLAKDLAPDFDRQLQRWVNVAAAVGIVGTVIGTIIGLLFSYPWLWVVGLGAWVLLLNAFVAYGRRSQPNTPTRQTESESIAPQPAPADPNSRQEQEATIELGSTAPLFILGGRFIPNDDSERRTISLPTFIEKWALWPMIEDGRTFVAKGAEFENCDIYGPGVFVLADGTVQDTFYKCDWEEEWQAFWPATKRGRYVGIIALENCKFRRCNFKGVAFVVKPDEYRRLYRRFTGDDLNGQ